MILATETPAIFAACCGWSARFDLSRPFVRAGYLWATDGRIAVRRPVCDGDADAYPARNTPKIEETWADFEANGRGEPIALPTGLSATVPCEACFGSGDDPYCPCDACHGDSDEPCCSLESSCEVCYGDGTWWNDERVPLGPVDLMAHYVAIMTSHGVTHVRPAEHPLLSVALEPVWFAGDGFEGLLMPMSRDPIGGLR